MKQWFARAREAAKVAFRPAFAMLKIAFGTILLPAIFGWLGDLASLFSAGTVDVPDVSTLGAALFSLASAAILALANFLFRWWQAMGLPSLGTGAVPAYVPAPVVQEQVTAAAQAGPLAPLQAPPGYPHGNDL